MCLYVSFVFFNHIAMVEFQFLMNWEIVNIKLVTGINV